MAGPSLPYHPSKEKVGRINGYNGLFWGLDYLRIISWFHALLAGIGGGEFKGL